jgi:hypothetical protein
LKAVVRIEYTIGTISMVGPENYQFHFLVFKGLEKTRRSLHFPSPKDSQSSISPRL